MAKRFSTELDALITTTNANQDFQDILSDPIFTPGLSERISDVRDLNEDLQDFLDGVCQGVHRSAVIYGPPGLGKTHSVTRALTKHSLKEYRDYVMIRSHATPMELYQILYQMRAQGKIVVLDDCDGILTNETGLNLVKAASDAKFRRVGWHSSVQIRTPSGKSVPNSFEFNGSLVVITNVRLAQGRGRQSNHWDAIRSRMPGFHMNLEDRSDQYAQIFYAVTELDYLNSQPETQISDDQKRLLLKFFFENLDRPRRLDLRLPETVAREMLSRPEGWQRRCQRILESA